MKGKFQIGNQSHSSMVFGCFAGVVSSVIVSGLLTALLSGLISGDKLGEGTAVTLIFLVRVISAAGGCFLAATLTKNGILPVVGITAGGYLLILLGIGITAFDGSFKNFGSGLLSVLIGGVIPCLIKLKAPKKSRKTRRLR